MKTRRTLTAIAVLTAILTCMTATAEAGTFDFKGRSFGFGGTVGLGVASQKLGAGFHFGLTTRTKLYRGLNMGGDVSMYIKSGAWDINFAFTPQYVFRIKNSIVHPYVGFGPSLHIVHRGEASQPEPDPWWDEGLYKLSGIFDEESPTSSSGARFGFQPNIGLELTATRSLSVYLDFKYFCVINAPDAVAITTGVLFYPF